MSQVELSVASQLSKIVEDLEKISKASKGVENDLKKLSNELDDNIAKGNAKVGRKLEDLRKLSGRVATQMLKDFKALASLNALQGAMSLSNQFKGTISDTLTLSDTIRKLGSTFGIAQGNFSKFQANITKGLGDIGLSSQVATDALQALADTPVRGEQALIGYSRAAGELASLSNQKGQEGGIAKGIAEVIRSQGGNPNDLKQVSKVAEDLRRVFNQTGKGPTETLKAMQDLFAAMPKDIRGKIGTRGLSNLAAAGQVAGPQSTQFLEELLGKSPIARKALEAQGFGSVISDKGLDIDKFKKASSAILGRIGMDPEAAAQTLGISEDAAKGFVRLAESLDKVKAAQDGIAAQTGSVDEQYKKSMGAGEAFRASINKVKSVLATPLAWATQKGTGLLSKASESGLGSAGVVAGGGLLAAILAGAGTRGLGKGLLGTLGKAGAAEAITGKEVQPVYVVNASEIGGGGGILGAAGGLLGGGGAAAGGAGLLARGGLYGAAAAVGIGAGVGLEKLYEKGAEKNVMGLGTFDKKMQAIFDQLYLKLGGYQIVQARPRAEIDVNLKSRDLQKAKPLTRGASY